jgi:hypothetical protein
MSPGRYPPRNEEQRSFRTGSMRRARRAVDGPRSHVVDPCRRIPLVPQKSATLHGVDKLFSLQL